MKKGMACLTAAVLLFSFTGCRREKTGATLAVNLDHSYTSQQVELDGDVSFISPLFAVGTEVALDVSYQGKSGEELLFLDPETGESRSYPLEVSGLILPLPDGKLLQFRQDIAVDKNWNTTLNSCAAVKMSADGKEEEIISVELPEDCQSMGDGAADADGRLYLTYYGNDSVSHLFAYDSDLQQMGEIDLGSWEIYRLTRGASGAVYAALWAPASGGDAIRLLRLDGTETEEIDTEETSFSMFGLETGYGDYELLLLGRHFDVYGIQINGTQTEEELLMDAIGSDFSSSSMGVTALPDGRLFIAEQPLSEDQWNCYLARERTQEEKDNIRLISLAGVALDDELIDAVSHFNRSQSEVRIVTVDYAQPDDPYPYPASVEAFQKDLLSGVVPDVICTDDLPFPELASKGLFEDLRPRLEKEIDPDDHLMNFFDSMEYSGKLQQIGFSYFLDTFTGRTERVGTETGLSVADFTAMAQDRPEDMTLLESGAPADNFLYYFVQPAESSFIDWEQGTCSFQTPEFAQLLSLSASMPSLAVLEQGTYSYADGTNVESDTALLQRSYISSPIDWHDIHAVQFKGDDVTAVGYPSAGNLFDPDFTISVNAMSKEQDLIWKWMDYMLSDEYQQGVTSLPVSREALAEQIEAAKQDSTHRAWDMLTQNEVLSGAATDAEMTQFMEMLEHTTASRYSDLHIDEILNEELGMYLAGDQTAEQAAEKIQSRAELYLSERK